MTGTLLTPQAGSPNSSEDPKISTAISTLNGVLTGSNLLDGAQLGSGTVASAAIADGTIVAGDMAAGAALANLAAASVTDTKLASPNNSVYKTVVQTKAMSIGGFGTGTFFPYYLISNGIDGWQQTGGGTTAANGVHGVFDFVSGDYSVVSLTTKFRVKMVAFVGGTSPSTVTFNAGLYPLTLSAGNYTLGTVVTGSTTGTSSTPSLATNTISRYASSDFAASALLNDPGTYVLGVVVGSITVPTGIVVALTLQSRNV